LRPCWTVFLSILWVVTPRYHSGWFNRGLRIYLVLRQPVKIRPSCLSRVRFPKNERSNIDKDEEAALKKLAAHLLALTVSALGQAQDAGELMEVDCDAKNQISHS
ncbi:MAG: type II toxin-antitoxin system RelE/ParE family toxin, partial [Nitrospirota bacterium]|nr:type II toxin-antitoxin system RelE/ParE family toxin [Nitrospirota bacterium]